MPQTTAEKKIMYCEIATEKEYINYKNKKLNYNHIQFYFY